MSKRDVHQEVTNSIIEAIESGAVDGNGWSAPWIRLAEFGMPENAATHKRYRGINVMTLWATAIERNYTSPFWASFKQWQSIGAQVRGGEKGSLIVFYKSLKIEDRDTGEEKSVPMLRHSSVFNAEQVDGFEAPVVEVPDVAERLDNCEALVSATGADIRTNGGRAYYQSSDDYIGMPARELFKSTEGYYSTLFHELVHWTGHKARLDRQFGSRFGDAQYAAEELVAELGSCFISAEIGLEPEPRQDHAEYVANWLKLLREDKKAIFTAAARAGDAAEYLQKSEGS